MITIDLVLVPLISDDTATVVTNYSPYDPRFMLIRGICPFRSTSAEVTLSSQGLLVIRSGLRATRVSTLANVSFVCDLVSRVYMFRVISESFYATGSGSTVSIPNSSHFAVLSATRNPCGFLFIDFFFFFLFCSLHIFLVLFSWESNHIICYNPYPEYHSPNPKSSSELAHFLL